MFCLNVQVSRSEALRFLRYFLLKPLEFKGHFTDLMMSDAQKKSPNKDINKKGEYVRPESGFRQRITADGSSGFKADKCR